MVLKNTTNSDSNRNNFVEPVDSLIDLATVQKQIHKGKSWIYKEISLKKFPSPLKLGRSSLWSQNEINQYIDKIKGL